MSPQLCSKCDEMRSATTHHASFSAWLCNVGANVYTRLKLHISDSDTMRLHFLFQLWTSNDWFVHVPSYVFLRNNYLYHVHRAYIQFWDWRTESQVAMPAWCYWLDQDDLDHIWYVCSVISVNQLICKYFCYSIGRVHSRKFDKNSL